MTGEGGWMFWEVRRRIPTGCPEKSETLWAIENTLDKKVKEIWSIIRHFSSLHFALFQLMIVYNKIILERQNC